MPEGGARTARRHIVWQTIKDLSVKAVGLALLTGIITNNYGNNPEYKQVDDPSDVPVYSAPANLYTDYRTGEIKTATQPSDCGL